MQELVSAEKTPTLPVVLPAYEKLLHLFKLMKPGLPNIVHGIDAAIEKLSAYFTKTRKTRIYALALRSSSFPILINHYLLFFSVINPTIKLKRLEANWTADEVAAAKGWMLEAVGTTSSFILLNQ